MHYNKKTGYLKLLFMCLKKNNIYIYIYGTVHAKIAYRVYIYKVIKMTHFEIAASPEP